MEIPSHQKWKDEDPKAKMASSNGFRYTNTCCWVKGSNPFVVSKDNVQPRFNKTQSAFNFKARGDYIDQNGNSNIDWANFIMGR